MEGPRHFLRNFDQSTVFEDCCSQVQKSTCQSFAIEFDGAAASCAVDPSSQDVQALLNTRAYSQESKSCLWLNLWGWSSDHETIIKDVAKHYHISPRLVQSLCPRQSSTTGKQLTVPSWNECHSTYDEAEKLEGASVSTREVPIESDPRVDQSASFSDIFDALWHFCTVDSGRRYICIGWNALFFLPHTELSTNRSKPNAIRVWSSLLLTDDGTIVSVFERPNDTKPDMVARIRRHQINVLRNLSRAQIVSSNNQNSLLYTAIRSVEPLPKSHSDSATEMASLLLYYLFDDWLNLFQQVSGSKDSYRHQLELLRGEMMKHAREEQINTLHQIGRQLNALRSICRSYRSIIEQILRKHITTSASSGIVRPRLYQTASCGCNQCSNKTDHTNTEDIADDVIQLSPAAVARFQRLLGRIDLCATNEVDECLTEKDALVQMNFNLISLKEAQSVEQLTRTTILLAKVTILFLPVSLTTGYFSMQLQGIQSMSLRTYWLTFMVVAIATIIFLGGFEFFSARYSGMLAYRPLAKLFFDRKRKSAR